MIRGKVIRYYHSSESCNCCPIYSVCGGAFNFEFSGRGVGVWTLCSGEEFFSALVLVIVLFTNFFTIFPVLICITALYYKAYLYLFDINIPRHSVSVQSTHLPNILCKLHREVGSVFIIYFM